MLNKNRNNRASHFQPAWAKRISAECAAYGIRPETVSIMCRDFGEKKMLFLLKKIRRESSSSRQRNHKNSTYI